MPEIVKLFSEELSEPYSVFTYHHFIHGWPDLCIMAFGAESASAPSAETRGTMIGCVVSKISRKGPGLPLRAYVAMLAVAKSFRGHKLGTKLVAESIQLMKEKGAAVVMLEDATLQHKGAQAVSGPWVREDEVLASLLYGWSGRRTPEVVAAVPLSR